MMRPSAELGFARAAADVLEDEGVAPSPSLSEGQGQLGSLTESGCHSERSYLSGRVRKLSRLTFASSYSLKRSRSLD